MLNKTRNLYPAIEGADTWGEPGEPTLTLPALEFGARHCYKSGNENHDIRSTFRLHPRHQRRRRR